MATDNNNDLFSKLGIEMGEGKLNIDINQTKDFLNSLKSVFEDTTETIKKDLVEGKIDMSENVGIKIDKEHINIDLSKTKNFIEELGKKMEIFIVEIDKAVDNISKK